jgi:hypothetical protein
MLLNIPKFLFAKDTRPVRLNGRTIIVTGFGCDPNCEVPVRLPAYIIPALALLREMADDKAKADVEFYFAENYSSLLLGQGFEPFVADFADRAIRYLEAYVANFHPNAPVRILRDRPILADEWLMIDEMASYLSQHGGDRIKQFAERRGGWEALKYMASHAWYMRDPLSALIGRRPLQVDGAENWDEVIMVGGAAEEIFYEARRVLAKMGEHSRWQSHQLFTPIGRRPTYHRVENEPILGDIPCSLEDMLSVSKEIYRDLLYLLVDASGEADFSIVERRNNLTAHDFICLRKGWNNLREVASLIS